MTMPAPDCLRHEARIMRAAAKRIWSESEDLLARATALNRAAQKLEAMADDEEDLARIAALAGRPVRLTKKARAA